MVGQTKQTILQKMVLYFFGNVRYINTFKF
jgi:hypothetical protein